MEKQKLPERKATRLPGYDYSTEGAYYITICTKKHEKLFGEVNFEGNAKVELNELGNTIKELIENIEEIVVYIIMPNHIHAIIEIDEKNNSASKIVTKLKSIITRKIGKSIWQRSFNDRIIRNEKEYANIWNYIENNAERWREDEFYIE